MEEIDNEQEQMKKLAMVRRLMTSILVRRIWIPVVLFVVAFVALFEVVGRRAMYAERFTAEAVLFFRPRQAERARAATTDEVVQILMRRTVREKIADRIVGGTAPEGFRATIARVTDFNADPRSDGVFYVAARASTAEFAVERANIFAAVCLEEYARYRNADLDVMLKSAEQTKRSLTERLEEIDKEEEELNRKLDYSQPKQDLARLNDAVMQRKSALSEANVRLAREKATERKLENDLALFPKDLVEGIETARALLNDVDKASLDVTDAETRYTEKNPKLIVARERLAALKAKFREFCGDHGIKKLDKVTVERVENMLKNKADARAQTNLATEMTEVLKAEIEKNEAEIRRLQEIMPNYDRLQRRRDSFHTSLAEVENTISDIRFQKASIPQDLTLVEPVRVPDETPPITPKKMMMVVILSGGFAGAALVLALAYELLLGRVHDIREVAFHEELTPVGSLPPETREFASQQDEKRIMDGLYYRFKAGLGDGVKTLMVGRLPNAEFSRRMHEALNWNCAMCGRRMLRVEFVSSREFEMTDDMIPAGGGVVMGRSRAFFPVNDISRLSPSEMTLLESDVRTLSEKYDLFVFGRRQPLSDDSIFFEQISGFCDATVVYVGARRTPRRCLRAAIEQQKKTGRPMLVIVSGEKSWRLVRGGLK